MKACAVFLDRDGVINVDKGYVHTIEDFEFFPGAIEGLQKLSSTDYKIIIVTGQSGIGRGYYSMDDFWKLTDYMLSELEKHDVRIDAIYYCPHAPDDQCACRKPNTYMIEQAQKKFDIDVTKSYMIGDKTADVKMGEQAGCKTVLIKGSPNETQYYQVRPDFTADNLFEAIKWCIENGRTTKKS